MEFKITTGKLKEPLRLLIYGRDGVGKTDFASQSPKPIFICAEQGTANFDVARFPEPKTFSEVEDMITWLCEADRGYQTLVIDTIDWLELLHNKKCEVELGKELSKIGYNNGYKYANQKFMEFVAGLSKLKNMNVIALAHSKSKTFNDPATGSGYDKYHLALREENANVFRQWADAVLFFDYQIFKKDEDDRFAFGEGKRVMYTEERPGFQAKCRFPVPACMPLDRGQGWKLFMDAVSAGEVSPEVLLKEISELMDAVKDETKRKQSEEYVRSISKDPRLLKDFKLKLVALKNGVA